MRTPNCSIITFAASAVCVTFCTSLCSEESAQAGRLELFVHNAAEVSGDVYPVSGGIPFPHGELSSVEGIRLLNASGKQLPVQTEMLASWDAGGKQVRWLLLDFQPEGLAAGKNRFTLEYGPEVAVKRDRPAVNPERSSWPPEQIIGSLYMIDQDGKEYASVPDDEETLIELETTGPLRTVVRVHVWLQDRQEKRICRVILRLHYFAGLNRVRILHSLVMDADPEVVKVQGLGLHLSGPEEPTGRVLLACEQNDNQFIESRGEVSLLQESDEHFVVDGGKHREGRRSGTWLSAVGDKNAIGVFLRNGWEEFPKGLKYDGQRIDVQLWPDDGCPMLDLGAIAEPILNPTTEEELREGLAAQPSASVSLYRFVTRGQKDWTMNSMLPLIQRAKELERELLPDRFAYYYVIFGKNGQGSMKTHELVIAALPAGVDGDQLNHFAKQVRTPPIVTASPQWNCRSGAFGPQIPCGTGEFADIDQTMTYDELDDTARFREKLCLYGARNFGDYLNGNPAIAGAVYKIYGEDAEVGITRRIGWMNNESHDTTIGAWLQFLRTCDPRIFYRAEAACEHVATVDQQHQFSSADRHLAESFYHTLNHYDGGPASSHTLSSGILLGYYVTGDRGLRETVIANADYYVEQQQQDGTGWYAGSSPSRSNIAPMTCILNAYTTTWDKKYLNSLNRFLVVWAGVYDVQKHYLGGTLPYPGAEFLRLVDHPIFEDAYCKIMDDLRTKKSIDGQSPYYMPGLIYMWQKTGDPTYLAYCRLVFQWYRHSLQTRGYADSVRRLVNGLPEFKYGMVSGYLAAGLAGLEEGRRKGVDFKAALKKLSAARSGELYYSIYGTLEGVPGKWVPSGF